MNHLHDAHDIKRCDRSFNNYILNNFESPDCACGQCSLKVSLHCRRLEFNLFADSCPNKQRFKNVSCLEYYIFRGAKATEALEYLRERQKTIGAKANTAEHIQKLSIINSGDNNPQSIKSIISRTNKTVEEVRTQLSLKSIGSNNGFYGKKHKLDTKVKMAKLRSEMPKRISSPELIIWGMLKALRIDFDYQHSIGPYIVDFYINGKVLEVYGDYWHGDKMLTSNKGRDDDKIKYLNDLGLEVIVVWESEISKETERVISILCGLSQLNPLINIRKSNSAS